MCRQRFAASFSLLLFSLAFLPLAAQTEELVSRELYNWYLEERFLIADRNQDAFLDRSEIELFPEEFVYYRKERNYELSDKNQDGYLSFNEIVLRVKLEHAFRYAMEQQDLRALFQAYPQLVEGDLRFLRENPALVARLFGNLCWMYERVELAEKLYNDKAWIAMHPEAAQALHRNLRWMVANPTQARWLYEDQYTIQRIPELLSWRADHQDLLRRLPRTDRFYELDFIPEGIRIQRN